MREGKAKKRENTSFIKINIYSIIIILCMSCPFKSKLTTNEKNGYDNIDKCPYKDQLSSLSTNRTFNTTSILPDLPIKNNYNKEDELSDDEDQYSGSCPVINRGKGLFYVVKRDPVNKHFEFYFDINYHREMDFIFNFTAGIPQKEFREKTKILNSYPKHLKYTLFLNNERLKNIQKKEFPEAFFAYSELKEKANKEYRKKNYREAIDLYYLAYSTLKWIEFTDENKKKRIITDGLTDSILDTEIIFKNVYIDDDKTSRLFESYDACLVYLLLNMSSAYMELRHYQEAISCLDECESICGEKIPDVLFRRSQARTYNKFSNENDLNLALKDIERAMVLRNCEIYEEHFKILSYLIEDKRTSHINRIEDLLSQAKYAINKIRQNKMNINEVVFEGNHDSQEMQNKILDEMRVNYISAIKFYTESKNKQQLNLAYKEIENFFTTYTSYKSYYNIDISSNSAILTQLSEENRKLFDDMDIIRYIKNLKSRKCEEIFAAGKFNFPLFQHCLNKVSSEMKYNLRPNSSIQLSSKATSTTYYYMLMLGIFVFSVAIMFFLKYYTSNFPKIRK